VVIGFFQFAIPREVLPIILRISNVLQIAADDSGRLVMLDDGDSVEASSAVGYANVTDHKPSRTS
jgi:hypothetical protein